MSFSRASDYEPQTQDKIIGLFVVIALAMLLALVFQRTHISTYTGDWIRLQAFMSKSYGVSKGTIIELSGVTIGTVASVSLQPDARVLLELRFARNQSGLLKQGSSFKVNSQLGIDTVLSGVRLELVPGQQESLLQDGDRVAIVEPKSLDQIMEELELDQVARKAKVIVANLEAISTTIVQKQDAISATLDNLNRLSHNLNEASLRLPETLNAINATNQQVQVSVQQFNQQLMTVTVPAADMMQSATDALVAAQATMEHMQPAVAQLPGLLESTRQTTQAIRYLSYQLSEHWLLGGSESFERGGSGLRMAPDDSLYRPNTGKAVSNAGDGRLTKVQQETVVTP